jgi:hypothetical protein
MVPEDAICTTLQASLMTHDNKLPKSNGKDPFPLCRLKENKAIEPTIKCVHSRVKDPINNADRMLILVMQTSTNSVFFVDASKALSLIHSPVRRVREDALPYWIYPGFEVFNGKNVEIAIAQNKLRRHRAAAHYTEKRSPSTVVIHFMDVYS